ncbi:hypothetical protein BD626DRAFT_631813 [Schizophyllum amplum]|uniref:Uncharacterized protein n=1 Tax=Schizophyllum amplum TaxID=97359 RepID=A0A550C900_9AGAR|nr:hypothetical protein BD626DRAFT_631813 [Auriculariopsis ampla]
MSHPREVIKCVISGATDHVRQCCPMKRDDDLEEFAVACQEWIFGIPRGSLPYRTQSWENTLCFREDIYHMYRRGQFLLAPTFRTYIDTTVFMEQRAGLTGRKDDDKSPRRPWSGLTSNGGPFRYVFIPFTDAARKLQEEFKMQPQTDDDLNYGKYPGTSREYLLDGSDVYPVIECYAHPFAVSTHADKAFQRRSGSTTPVRAQWHACASDIVDQWRCEEILPPQWFVDAPKYELDDSDLSSTEAYGYDPSATSEDTAVSEPAARRLPGEPDADAEGADPHTKVLTWLGKVDLRSKPLEEEWFRDRSPRKLRRSDRIAARSCPYTSTSPRHNLMPSPTRRAPWPSVRGRDPLRYPPAWVKRNGHFPTPKFSSNDWAYFQYGSALAARNDGEER